MKQRALVLFFLGMLAVGSPGCDNPFTTCDKGKTRWQCNIKPTACHMAEAYIVCAANEADAINAANAEALYRMKPRDPIVGTTCTDLGSPKRSPQDEPPPPSCDQAAGDNACVACAKIFCCSSYQACMTDTNCSCLVDCLSSGGTLEGCTAPELCGDPDAISTTAAFCLQNAFPSECASMGSMCDPGGGAGGGAP